MTRTWTSAVTGASTATKLLVTAESVGLSCETAVVATAPIKSAANIPRIIAPFQKRGSENFAPLHSLPLEDVLKSELDDARRNRRRRHLAEIRSVDLRYR